MHTTLHFSRGSSDRTWRCRLIGSPLSLCLTLLAVVSLTGFVVLAGRWIRDGYLPYEGQVIAIKPSRMAWLVFESGDLEYLRVRTPAGHTISRLVSFEVRSRQRVRVGDYVVKQRGFWSPVRPRDKLTTQEILDGAPR